jgi:hypothetical protein
MLRLFVAANCFAMIFMGLGVASAQNTTVTTPAIETANAVVLQNSTAATGLVTDAGWKSLKAQQQKALAPLAPYWSQISASQKNKWLAMSNNFDNLSAKEQATLHERMADWAALSPQQRAQARLIFNETKSLGSDEKKTHWEAYQALSSEEKKKLASQQTTGIQGAATASQATSPTKVIRLPGKSAPANSSGKLTPGMVIDKKTLLPTPVVIPEGT